MSFLWGIHWNTDFGNSVTFHGVLTIFYSRSVTLFTGNTWVQRVICIGLFYETAKIEIVLRISYYFFGFLLFGNSFTLPPLSSIIYAITLLNYENRIEVGNVGCLMDAHPWILWYHQKGMKETYLVWPGLFMMMLTLAFPTEILHILSECHW